MTDNAQRPRRFRSRAADLAATYKDENKRIRSCQSRTFRLTSAGQLLDAEQTRFSTVAGNRLLVVKIAEGWREG